MPLVGCSGHSLPLSVCVSNPVLTTRDSCAGLDSLENVSIKVNSYFRQQIPIRCVCKVPPVVQPTLLQGPAQCRYFQTIQLHSIGTRSSIWIFDFGMVFGFFYVYGSMDWGWLRVTNLTAWPSLLPRLLKSVFDNVQLDHGGLPDVLPLAVHLEWLRKLSWHSGVLTAGIWTMYSHVMTHKILVKAWSPNLHFPCLSLGIWGLDFG